MITNTTDYSGRSVDLEYLQTVLRADGVVPVSQSFTRTQPKMVAGMQKLLQRYVVLLLTQVGDVFLAPEQGTTFLQEILRGGGRSRGYIVQTFAFANADVLEQLKREDNNETLFGVAPDDEKIRASRLLDYSVDFTSATLSLTVYIENKVGEAFAYVVPVPVPRS